MSPTEKVARILEFVDEMKAERVETLDVQGKTITADYLIVCSGNSDLHVRSIADKVAERMRALRARPRSVEGRESGWVLLDFGDVILHIMREEPRQFYDLESLWKTMPKNDSLEA